jgi:regulator of sigma D
LNGHLPGSFYYVAAALRGKDGYVGTNAVFLGDRIYPQSIEVHEGQVIVNYADRRPNEPFTAQPTVNMSKYLKVVGEKLTDINI